MGFLDTFYTPQTLLTLTGAATAVWLITSVVSYLFDLAGDGKAVKWVGFILSLSIALLGAWLAANKSAVNWIVAGVNGFVIYVTAVGVNAIVSHGETVKQSGAIRQTSVGGRTLRKILSRPWWA